MVSPNWAPIFKTVPFEIRRALAESLLTAWMDKTQQYNIAKYLPILALTRDYASGYAYSDISGGKVWRAMDQFHAIGVSDDLVGRLQNWGFSYTDRAARVQYH
jgi:hypothetical protein